MRGTCLSKAQPALNRLRLRDSNHHWRRQTSPMQELCATCGGSFKVGGMRLEIQPSQGVFYRSTSSSSTQSRAWRLRAGNLHPQTVSTPAPQVSASAGGQSGERIPITVSGANKVDISELAIPLPSKVCGWSPECGTYVLPWLLLLVASLRRWAAALRNGLIDINTLSCTRFLVQFLDGRHQRAGETGPLKFR